MTESRDEWIMKRAYSLWEEEGYPTGRDSAHWEQAAKERAVMETTAPHGLEVKPKTRRSASASTTSKSNGATPPAAVAAKSKSKKDVSAKV